MPTTQAGFAFAFSASLLRSSSLKPQLVLVGAVAAAVVDVDLDVVRADLLLVEAAFGACVTSALAPPAAAR